MVFFRTACCITIALLPVTSLAQPPFPLNGLHTELTFVEAVAQGQKIGGSCKDSRPTLTRDGVAAACQYTHCNDSGEEQTCNQADASGPAFTIANQPVTLVEFEAPAPGRQVNSIGIFFEGEHAAVMAELVAAFGPPNTDTESARKQSWTKSRRLFWHRGIQRAALLDSPKMILLAADRNPASEP